MPAPRSRPTRPPELERAAAGLPAAPAPDPASMSHRWMRGVAANPAAPASVLLRLLAVEGKPAWTVLCGERSLPDDVVEAALAHPAQLVRGAVSINPHIPAAQRGRLAEDADSVVLYCLAEGPVSYSGRPEPLPDEAIARLLTLGDDPSALINHFEVVEALEKSWQIPVSFLRRAPSHPDPAVRKYAAASWLILTEENRAALLTDPDPAVREEAERQAGVLDPKAMEAALPERACPQRTAQLSRYAVSEAVAQRCIDEDRDVRLLAGNPFTPPAAVEQLAWHPDPAVRARVAGRCDLDPEVLDELANDPDPVVRLRAVIHPAPRTEPQREAIERVIGRTAEEVGQVRESMDELEPEWAAACATSGHTVLRRVAATYPALPADLVERLARDPDEHVRRLLAYNHPLAPPHLLLEAFLAVRGMRGFLRLRPTFPRTGLAALLKHPDPEVRAIAAADPALPEPPLGCLLDPDPAVRSAVARNPVLPLDIVTSLVEKPDFAEAAAGNPTLPAEYLDKLLDRAGVPR